jgi:hypothetical protein
MHVRHQAWVVRCLSLKVELTLQARRGGLQKKDGAAVAYVMKRLQVLATAVSFLPRHEVCSSRYDKRTAADELGIGLEDRAMKKIMLIAAAASLAAVMALPASANPQARDTMMTRMASTTNAPSSVPEPGTLALLALGIGSLGIARRRRR